MMRLFRPTTTALEHHWLPRARYVVAGIVLIGACACANDPGDVSDAAGSSASTVSIPEGLGVPTPLPFDQLESDATVDEDSGFSGVGSFDETNWFASCADAVIAGKAPLREGEPGYRPDLDPDGDGLTCNRREPDE